MSVGMQMQLMRGLETFMQVSILVPMLVTWWRGQRLPAPIRLASKYVYLSAFCVITGKLAAYYFHNNQLSSVAFNVGKLLLFAVVYAQVLAPTRWHWLLRRAVVVALCVVAGLLFYDWRVTVSVARIAQLTLLAGYALAYLDQSLHPSNTLANARDPLWLLSIGNLLYAACAVTAANMGIFNATQYKDQAYFVFISCSSLMFNAFLTLALVRARPAEEALPDADVDTQSLANA